MQTRTDIRARLVTQMAVQAITNEWHVFLFTVDRTVRKIIESYEYNHDYQITAAWTAFVRRSWPRDTQEIANQLLVDGSEINKALDFSAHVKVRESRIQEWQGLLDSARMVTKYNPGEGILRLDTNDLERLAEASRRLNLPNLRYQIDAGQPQHVKLASTNPQSVGPDAN